MWLNLAVYFTELIVVITIRGLRILSISNKNKYFWMIENVHALTLVMAGLRREQRRRGGGPRDPHPITLLKINSFAPNLACWFAIMSNLFHIIILNTLPWGTSEYALQNPKYCILLNLSKSYFKSSVFP